MDANPLQQIARIQNQLKRKPRTQTQLRNLCRSIHVNSLHKSNPGTQTQLRELGCYECLPYLGSPSII
jgi:hypothetical protein